MDIGSVQDQAHYRSNSFRSPGQEAKHEDERNTKHRGCNACFICRKKGCYVWKHSKEERKQAKWNSTAFKEKSELDSDLKH